MTCLIQQYSQTLSRGSMATVKSSLRKIAENNSLGNWSSITGEDLKTIRGDLMRYAGTTRRKMASIFLKFLEYLVKQRKIQPNIYSTARTLLRFPREVSLEKHFRLVTINDLNKMLGIMPGIRGARDQAIVAVAYTVGLKRYEIVELALDDYKEGNLRIRDLTLQLPARVCALLDEWVSKRGDVPGPLFCIINGQNVPWPDEPMCGQNIQAIVTRLSELAGIGRIYPSDLRASFIARQLESGKNPEWVRKVVGHKSIITTMNYGLSEVDEKLEDI